ncbi:endocuticle structural protein SgAbd-6-like [Drosophila hydei]|uniref:Endocuticle structural protein SgAbd-6-like n=1 Tax=Drosophila hydei TaxID=7224 RepID=A0A6J1M0F7_DROHY|nr:endocuticle structural protein SgAbd-6-like [Drosophila hydei]
MIRPQILGLIILLAISICCNVEAAPSGSKTKAHMLKFENGNGYAFYYETIDGISRQETAELKHAGTDLEAIAVQGSIHWVEPNGVHYELSYLADENGFQPQAKTEPPLKSDH